MAGVVSRNGPRLLAQTLFAPTMKEVPAHATVASHQLMLRAGLIRQQASGIYHLLPSAIRSLDKLTAVVNEEMAAIGAQRLCLSLLTPGSLWKKTGRWDLMGEEMMRLEDRKGTDFCLAPTHEEAITELAASHLSSHRQLPLLVYQLDRKFRDEARPRAGLMRGREFWMKDLYTFDASEDEAHKTYDAVCEAYARIMDRLRLPYIRVAAHTGNIGGSLSHEYHIVSDIGEDELVVCDSCGYQTNVELLPCESTASPTPNSFCKQSKGTACGSRRIKGVEVGHAFFLGTKYSKTFDAAYIDHNGASQTAVMGCYGLGITRMLQASIEVSHDKDGIIWHPHLAPYKLDIVCMPSKTVRANGSTLEQEAEALYDFLNGVPALKGEVVLDTRDTALGMKMKDALLHGFPWTIVVGGKFDPNRLEVRERRTGETRFMTRHELVALVEQSTLS